MEETTRLTTLNATDKTVTLVEAILQIVENTQARILIAAPSNSAADLLAIRLAKDCGKMINSKSLHRVNAKIRDPITVPKDVLQFCKRSPDGQTWDIPDAVALSKFRVIIATCSSAFPLRAKHLRWDYLFVDEAAQASEAERKPSLICPRSRFHTHSPTSPHSVESCNIAYLRHHRGRS